MPLGNGIPNPGHPTTSVTTIAGSRTSPGDAVGLDVHRPADRDIPAGVVNIVTSRDQAAAITLTKDPRVDMVSFTFDDTGIVPW